MVWRAKQSGRMPWRAASLRGERSNVPRDSAISMTQSGDPLENAIAERANGILKSEWLYKMTIPSREICKVELARIIDFYNIQRPHMSIWWQTPQQAHSQYGEQQRCWKNYYHQVSPSEPVQLGVYVPYLTGLTEESIAEEVAV